MGSRGFLVSVILNFVAATVNVIDIGKHNENILEETEVVLVNFYADWCRFSRQLHPIFVNSANLIREGFDIKFKKMLSQIINFPKNSDPGNKKKSGFPEDKKPVI